MNLAGFHLRFGIGALIGAVAVATLAGPGCDPGDEPDPILVSMTTPADESYVNGEVTVSVDVTGEADNVALLVDGAVVDTRQSAPWEFSWDSTAAQEGLHTLQVVAYGPGGSQGQSSDCRVIVDRTPPILTVPELSLPAVLQGTDNELEVTAEDEAGILAVRLLSGGSVVDECDTASCVANWDVSALSDGAVELTVEAEDLTGNRVTQVLPALVVNDGTVIELLEGEASGNWIIPESWATMDLDMKYHWNMPAGVTAILAALQWDRGEWPFELAIGTGECPHAGTEHASVDGHGGQVVLHHSAQDLGSSQYAADQMWFTHLAAGADLDMAANVGEGTRVGFVVVLY
jgi:hypothetical protein